VERLSPGDAFAWYRNAAGGYAIRLPAGWHRRAKGASVRTASLNTVIGVTVRPAPGQPVDATQIARALARQAAKGKITHPTAARPVTLPAGRALRSTYVVTHGSGRKATRIITTRYDVIGSRHVAVLTFGAPRGTGNGPAFLLMARSFRWR
jgi:hypothetical protein